MNTIKDSLLVKEYSDNLLDRFSAKTVNEYTSIIRMFLKCFIMHKTKNERYWDSVFACISIDVSTVDMRLLHSITLDDVVFSVNFMKNEMYNSNTTINKKLYCLKNFFEFFKIDLDLTAIIDQNKKENCDSNHITHADLQLLLEHTKGRNAIRDACIISLTIFAGLKVTEICNLNIDDVKENAIQVSDTTERYIYISSETKALLNMHILDLNAESSLSNALFLSERKQRISPRSVETIIKNILKKSDLDKKYSIRSLRNDAEYFLSKLGLSKEMAKSMLGKK